MPQLTDQAAKDLVFGLDKLVKFYKLQLRLNEINDTRMGMLEEKLKESEIGKIQEFKYVEDILENNLSVLIDFEKRLKMLEKQMHRKCGHVFTKPVPGMSALTRKCDNCGEYETR